jgi:hypothetical protein
MPNPYFPPLPLAHWRPARDTIQSYAQVLGRIRRALTPSQKHWWHISLRAAAAGLTTTPIPDGDQAFELLLDLTHHRLLLTTSRGQRRDFPLEGQPVHTFMLQTLELLADQEIVPEIDQSLFTATSEGTYERTAVAAFWQAASQVDAALKEFRHGFRRESSPVQLWPHHFDLALLWFSGRLVPDQNPDNPEYADEQMNFGFSTGDEGIPDPYFYATAYPLPDGWSGSELPAGAYWQTEGWTGAVLPYAAVSDRDDGRSLLLNFLRSAHEAGAALMSE